MQNVSTIGIIGPSLKRTERTTFVYDSTLSFSVFVALAWVDFQSRSISRVIWKTIIAISITTISIKNIYKRREINTNAKNKWLNQKGVGRGSWGSRLKSLAEKETAFVHFGRLPARSLSFISRLRNDNDPEQRANSELAFLPSGVTCVLSAMRVLKCNYHTIMRICQRLEPLTHARVDFCGAVTDIQFLRGEPPQVSLLVKTKFSPVFVRKQIMLFPALVCIPISSNLQSISSETGFTPTR